MHHSTRNELTSATLWAINGCFTLPVLVGSTCIMYTFTARVSIVAQLMIVQTVFMNAGQDTSLVGVWSTPIIDCSAAHDMGLAKDLDKSGPSMTRGGQTKASGRMFKLDKLINITLERQHVEHSLGNTAACVQVNRRADVEVENHTLRSTSPGCIFNS